jgi:hypothetical protein
MTVIVVDFLEAVEIDQQQMHRPFFVASRVDGLVQITREAKAVRERGERVSLGEEQGLLARNAQLAGAVQHTRFEVTRKRRKVAIRAVEFERLRLEQRFRLPARPPFAIDAPLQPRNTADMLLGLRNH